MTQAGAGPGEGWSRGRAKGAEKLLLFSRSAASGHPSGVDGPGKSLSSQETSFCSSQNSKWRCWAASGSLQDQSPVSRESSGVCDPAGKVEYFSFGTRLSAGVRCVWGQCTFSSSERDLCDASEHLHFQRGYKRLKYAALDTAFILVVLFQYCHHGYPSLWHMTCQDLAHVLPDLSL